MNFQILSSTDHLFSNSLSLQFHGMPKQQNPKKCILLSGFLTFLNIKLIVLQHLDKTHNLDINNLLGFINIITATKIPLQLILLLSTPQSIEIQNFCKMISLHIWLITAVLWISLMERPTFIWDK